MFQLLLKLKIRVYKNQWCERMTKILDSQLGHGSFEPNSTNFYFFGKAATASAVAEKISRPKRGLLSHAPPMYAAGTTYWGRQT